MQTRRQFVVRAGTVAAYRVARGQQSIKGTAM
jgi:hypothetical protein